MRSWVYSRELSLAWQRDRADETTVNAMASPENISGFLQGSTMATKLGVKIALKISSWAVVKMVLCLLRLLQKFIPHILQSVKSSLC